MLYCDSCTSLISDIICPICVTSRQRTIENLMSDRWSDCSFLVGVEPHQEVIAGHKLLLAIASPVFDAMFYGPMAKNNDGPIRVDDTDPEIFKAMLQYIYTCKMKTESLDVILNLCYLAKKYLLHHLMAECILYLRLEITAENVQEIYKHAVFFDVEILNKACLEMIDLVNEKQSGRVSNDGAAIKLAHEQSSVAYISSIKKEVADSGRLAEATVRFTIRNFGNFDKQFLITPPFFIWNLPWQLMFEPNCDDILAITICCNTRQNPNDYWQKETWSCWAKSEIRIISNKPDVMPLQNIELLFDRYDSRRTSWRHEFLTWNELLDPKNEYIKDDALTLEVKLKVEEPEGEAISYKYVSDKTAMVFTLKVPSK